MHIICFDLLSRSSETKHLLVVDCQAERPNQRHTAVAGGGLLSLWTSVHTNAWGHRRRWWSVHTQTHTETHAHKYQHGHVTCYHLTHMQVNTEAHKYTIAGLYSLNSSRTHTHTHTNPHVLLVSRCVAEYCGEAGCWEAELLVGAWCQADDRAGKGFCQHHYPCHPTWHVQATDPLAFSVNPLPSTPPSPILGEESVTAVRSSSF
jgi:hypothetical protein